MSASLTATAAIIWLPAPSGTATKWPARCPLASPRDSTELTGRRSSKLRSAIADRAVQSLWSVEGQAAIRRGGPLLDCRSTSSPALAPSMRAHWSESQAEQKAVSSSAFAKQFQEIEAGGGPAGPGGPPGTALDGDSK